MTLIPELIGDDVDEAVAVDVEHGYALGAERSIDGEHAPRQDQRMNPLFAAARRGDDEDGERGGAHTTVYRKSSERDEAAPRRRYDRFRARRCT